MFEFKLPDLGEGIHEGELLKWHVSVGEVIAEDDNLVDIETDKAAVTIPSPASGKVLSLAGKVGDTLFVGDVIATFDGGSATAAAPAAIPATDAGRTVPEPVAAPAASTAAQAAPSRPAGLAVAAAPATRQLARELGVDLNAVDATGPGGRVTPADVRAHADGGGAASTPAIPETPGTPGYTPGAVTGGAGATIPLVDLEPLPDFSRWGPVTTEPLRSIRRKVARKMATSMAIIPHVAHMDEADVTDIMEYRRREKAATGASAPTLLAFVVKAITEELLRRPGFNASLDPFSEQIIYKQYYNVGIAVDSGRGLIVPVIRDTNRKSLREIAGDIVDLAGRARDNKLEIAELRGGTFTVTNIGALGGTGAIPTINYPEVAILAMGQVQKRPVVRNDQVVVREMLPMTLAFDHRIVDGADAARFVTALRERLSDPLRWLLASG